MELKEQNWKNFTANHLRDWHGIWTRYTPEGEVKESFQSLRSFQSHREQTAIHQTNRYIYAEDNFKEESWDYNQQDNSLPDGIYHPQADSMRNICLESGHAAWVAKQLKPDSYFGAELFFRHEELRHSVGIVYDKHGTLFRTANIREDARGFPSKFWSREIEQVSKSNLSGNWQGTSVTMTPDLKISQPVPTQLHWGWEGHNTFFLPDGVAISCPELVSVGNPFTIAANWLITPSKLQQLSVKYDESGAFSALTLAQLHL